MKKLLNTLYVITPGSYLSKEGEAIEVRVDGETKLHLPIHTISSIVCFGQVLCTPPLMGFCAERNVGLCFLSQTGRFLARIQGPVSGNVLLRREQYRRADDMELSSEIARAIVIAKIINGRSVLLRAIRNRDNTTGTAELSDAASHLAELLKELEFQQALDSVRGREGEAARRYFAVFDQLILVQKDDFFFCERNRRPPLDNVNALLSFLYTLLLHDCVAALESVGLDPAVGFLHRDRPGRPGLALDLMEEFRSCLIDRLVLAVVNLRQITGKGFRQTETGAVVMDDETRKQVIVAYQQRKQEEIQHPFLNEKVAVGLLPFAQALLLARYLRGDLDGYPPFIWR